MPDKPDRTPKEVRDPFVRRLADEIRKERVAQDLSQKRLAEIAGVGRTGLVMLEQYHRMPTVWFCKCLADALELPLAELIARAERSGRG